MPTEPPTYVVDANILIDLHIGRVLWEVLGLPISLVAPDLVVGELHEPSGELLVSNELLASVELPPRQVQELDDLHNTYRGLSVSDCASLVLAKMLKVTLLSGDGELRRAATLEGLAVRGTLWLIDEMVEVEAVSHGLAMNALRLLEDRRNGRRLPRSEITKRQRSWGPQSGR